MNEAGERSMSEMPWDRVELRGWSLVGMNHYHVNGERRLFVAMTDSAGRCVKAEGRDEVEVFKSLARQVFNYRERQGSGA